MARSFVSVCHKIDRRTFVTGTTDLTQVEFVASNLSFHESLIFAVHDTERARQQGAKNPNFDKDSMERDLTDLVYGERFTILWIEAVGLQRRCWSSRLIYPSQVVGSRPRSHPMTFGFPTRPLRYGSMKVPNRYKKYTSHQRL